MLVRLGVSVGYIEVGWEEKYERMTQRGRDFKRNTISLKEMQEEDQKKDKA